MVGIRCKCNSIFGITKNHKEILGNNVECQISHSNFFEDMGGTDIVNKGDHQYFKGEA